MTHSGCALNRPLKQGETKVSRHTVVRLQKGTKILIENMAWFEDPYYAHLMKLALSRSLGADQFTFEVWDRSF